MQLSIASSHLVTLVLLAASADADGSAWVQVGASGLGDPSNHTIGLIVEFEGAFYVGVSRDSSAGLYRSSDGVTWTQVGEDGFGNPENTSIAVGAEHDGHLYAGTSNLATGGEIWRSSDGTSWEQVGVDGLGDPENIGVAPSSVFDGHVYAFTNNLGFFSAAQIWRSPDGENWAPVMLGGFGSLQTDVVVGGPVFPEGPGGALYVGTANFNGGEIWRTFDGTTWSQVGTTGFGDLNNFALFPTIAHGGYVYAGTINPSPLAGGEIWRSADGTRWNQVARAGFGDPFNLQLAPSGTYGSELIAVATGSPFDGGTLWRSIDGTSWVPISDPGFGNPGNSFVLPQFAFGDGLYASTMNFVTGGELWKWDLAPLGASHCSAAPNSTGSGAEIAAEGDASLEADCFRIGVTDCPPGVRGWFFLGTPQAGEPLGDGELCTGGPLFRIDPMVTTGADGSASFSLDFDAPYAAGILTGSDTSYQFWYEDPAAGGFNLSNAVTVVHTP